MLPPAAELAATCERVVRAWHELAPELDWRAASSAFPVGGAGWTDAVARLCLINCFQWHLEDASRAAYADAERLARLKREIDASNQRRVACIDELDARLLDELGAPADGAAPVAVTTPGNVLDRISILALKRAHAGAERAAMLDEQLADACDGLDRLVADLAAARQRLRRHRTLKLYGEPR